jgi:hypothetical protein
MNTEDLKKQLASETQAKSQSIELAKIALMNSATSFQRDLSESAQNFRSDLRDEMKTARDDWKKTTDAERQAWSEERKQWETAKRKVLLWGPLAVLAVVLVTASLSVAVTWIAVSKGTGMALAGLQQGETSKLADLRGQTETATKTLNEVQEVIAKQQAEAQKTLAGLQQQIAEQNQILADAKARNGRLNSFAGRNGEIYVEVMPDSKPFTYQGKTLIQAKTSE